MGLRVSGSFHHLPLRGFRPALHTVREHRRLRAGLADHDGTRSVQPGWGRCSPSHPAGKPLPQGRHNHVASARLVLESQNSKSETRVTFLESESLFSS